MVVARELTLNELVNTINTGTVKDERISTCLVVPQNRKDDFSNQGKDNKPVNFALLKTTGGITEKMPYRLDHYAIVLCLQGSCKKTVGHYAFTIQPGSLHFIFPGMINTFDDSSDDLQLYMVLFKRDFFSDMYIKDGVLESMLDSNVDFPPVCNLDDENFTIVKSLIEQMYREYAQGGLYHIQVIQSILMQLFYLSGRFLQDSIELQPIHISRGHQLTQQFKREVGKYFLTKRTVQEYADMLFVTSKYLSEVVKQETGETPLKLIHKRLYYEALYLLNYNSMSIKEISDFLNFDTPSHFSRFFKQFAGYTPSAFKKGIT
ncbi:MAG TPA: AraC family transcriptional regulator [Arachidicoccus sp.]